MQNFAALRAVVFPLFMKNLRGADICPPPVGARVKCWLIFDPKSRDMTSLKSHFLKTFSTDFAEILFEDAKLMVYIVP